MFVSLGTTVARAWFWILMAWVLALAGSRLIAPPLDSVVQTGEFAFLPESSPSRVAERIFAKAFPDQAQASTIAVIARRVGAPLRQADLDFVDDGVDVDPTGQPEGNVSADLSDHLRQIVVAHHLEPRAALASNGQSNTIPVISHQDRNLGGMLVSSDQSATLLLLELPTEFLDTSNRQMIAEIENLLFHQTALTPPPGLELYLSGTAVVGRDMLQAARDSAKATEHLTIVLVIVLLILIYRAPLLALVPLLTVFASVRLTMNLLCWMAGEGWVTLFTGIESYVTVLLYGAGVDYCLFLIARFKEEIDKGISPTNALVDSVSSVGAAIAASAGTVICGIGMMIFAEFGKFRDAGIAISFGLVIVLAASLTLTPALLRAAGRHVFWPRHNHRDGASESSGPLQRLWDQVSHQLELRPGMMWAASLLLMLPFAVVGVWFFSDLSYGLLTDLPPTSRSVVGTNVVRHHFADGLTGPTTVVLRAPEIDFRSVGEDNSGVDLVARFSERLSAEKASLQLDDIRSVAFPLGGQEGLASIRNPATYKITLGRSLASYVGQTAEGQPAHETRLELVTTGDPFSRDSIMQLDHLQQELQRNWREVSQSPAEFFVLGATASIRDLKNVTDRDQIRIDLLATIGVFLILVALLRRTAVCVYLILSVLLSYFATLGMTYLLFWWQEGPEFAGLDWKVPMFLFTILIAVGEDYNIFLMSRVAEEQRQLGRIRGIIHALSLTGRIISSCGIIMAGTFASLAAGSLKGMSQLGVALAIGVLLDTFVVRPILVPAYLVLLERGAFGAMSSWMGRLPDNFDESESSVVEARETLEPVESTTSPA